MAFETARLSVLAYANGFTFWHYLAKPGETPDDTFFDPAADQLREGDLVAVTEPGAATGAASVRLVAIQAAGNGAAATVGAIASGV